MDILQAIHDPLLFQPFLGDLSTWNRWEDALRAVYGLGQLQDRALVRQCTGRMPRKLPSSGFQTSLFICGRRSGKSRVSAIVAAFEAALSGREKTLAAGERGIVAVVSPTREQSKIVHSYIRAIFSTPLLAGEVVAETADTFELKNGVRIEICTGDHKSIRGRTLLCAVVDELAFFGVGDETKIKSDTELIRGILPGLATTQGRLICITSPYARRGWTFATFQKHLGNDAGSILVWNAASRTMNPTLPQSVVDAAMIEDMQACKSEYLAEFRDDVCEFLPRALIESLVARGRQELLPRQRIDYSAFVDLSGGRSDSAACAVAHREGPKVIVDLCKEYHPPFDPLAVIGQMVSELKKIGIRTVVGDNYAAEFCARGFISHGMRYLKSDKPKSALYLELLPRMCSGEIEIPDVPRLISQLAALERRTRVGGKDSVDSPPNGHDDLSNALAGVAFVAGKSRRIVGAFSIDSVSDSRAGLAAMAAHSHAPSYAGVLT